MQKYFPILSHQNGIKPLKTLWIRSKTPGFQGICLHLCLWKTFGPSHKIEGSKTMYGKFPENLIYFAFISLQSAKNML